MYLLYPRISLAIAEKLATDYSAKSIEELVVSSDIYHEQSVIAPVGGNKVEERKLKTIQRQIRDCAKHSGYPTTSNEDNFGKFDYECAVLMYNNMFLHPSEASH